METKSVNISIRWMIRRDMPEVMAIENSSFDYPWPEEEFLRHLRHSRTIGMVAEEEDFGGRILGFMIYEFSKRKILLHRLAVNPGYRRSSVGRKLAAKLQSKLSEHRRDEINVNVRESNRAAHYFFKTCGFLAVALNREHFVDSGEDSYQFQYRLRSGVQSNV